MACFCFFLGTLVVFVFWSRLRRVTFQRWKVTKDRRACGPGPGGGGAAVEIRGLQALWLLPAVLASALNTSAIGPSGGYPPCKTCRQFRWRGCTHAAFRTAFFYLMDLGLSRLGVFLLACCAFKTFSSFIAFNAFSFAQSSIEMWKTSEKIFRTDSTQNYLVEDGSPKGGMSTAPPTKLLTNFARGISARGANGRSIEGGG